MQSVVLSCDFKPPPKAVQWYKEETPLAPSSKFKMRLEGHMAELRVLRLTPDDAGVYRCQAGSAQSSAEVTVEGRERGRGPQHKRPWRRKWQLTPYSCLGNPIGIGQRSLVGYSPWGRKEHTHTHVSQFPPHPGKIPTEHDLNFNSQVK